MNYGGAPDAGAPAGVKREYGSSGGGGVVDTVVGRTEGAPEAVTTTGTRNGRGISGGARILLRKARAGRRPVVTTNSGVYYVLFLLLTTHFP
jgi:hypothetical protein